MKKISSRSREVAELIRDRQTFQTYGALRAEEIITPHRLSIWDSGQLSGEDLEKFRDECQIIRYVVWSYSTPIAWWAGYLGEGTDYDRTAGHGWYAVKAKFSRTTSVHQGKLYLIPRCLCSAPHGSTECPEHPTCQGQHMTVPDWDCETEALSLSDCKHWGKPGTECAGPRVGVTPDGVILCERHFNQHG